MTSAPVLTLAILPDRLAVARLPVESPIPALRLDGGLISLTVTADEVSLVCAENAVPPSSEQVMPGWRALRVVGKLDFALIGILASLTAALASAGVSVFALSTYNTDYLLVRAEELPHAVDTLRAAGHVVRGE